MGSLKNIKVLERLKEYATDTNFGNQSIGNQFTLSFLPTGYDKSLSDIRYSFRFRHRLLDLDLDFHNVTYSEAIIEMVMAMHKDLKHTVTEQNFEFYKEMGLIDVDDFATIELMSSTIGNGIVSNIIRKQGNISKSYKTTDNLQNVFEEYRPAVVKYFLKNIDAYQPSN